MHRKKTKLAARAHRLGTAIERRGIAATYELHDRLLSNRASRRKFAHGRPEFEVLEAGYALLERLRIADDALVPVKELPYGKQRLVEIAIALGLRPTVLLLDEPAAGVPSGEIAMILDVIEQLPSDIAGLIIEHDMELVFRFARRITVLVQGSVLIEGTPAEIAADARVREVYLGEGHHG